MRLGVLAAAVMLTAGAASAEFVAYTGQPNPPFVSPPLQAYGGSLGMNFTVNSAIVVDQMGVFNAAANGVISGNLQVALFEQNPDSSWSLVPGTYADFTPSNSGTPDLVNDGPYDLYQAIAPVLLQPGDYAVVAVGFDSADPDGNENNGGVGATEDTSGLLSYTGAEYTVPENGLLAFPNTPFYGQPNVFDAGTFEFSQAPEPASFILIGTGLVLVTFAGLRKRRSSEKEANLA
jgi:hypothetical protein